jgi:hypothetical protein
MEDRRIFERMQANFPVKYLDPIGGLEGQASTVDICANGVCLIVDKDLPKKTGIEMWLKIPDKREPFYTRGEVVWSKAGEGSSEKKVGVRLKKAELMGVARALWLNKEKDGN